MQLRPWEKEVVEWANGSFVRRNETHAVLGIWKNEKKFFDSVVLARHCFTDRAIDRYEVDELQHRHCVVVQSVLQSRRRRRRKVAGRAGNWNQSVLSHAKPFLLTTSLSAHRVDTRSQLDPNRESQSPEYCVKKPTRKTFQWSVLLATKKPAHDREQQQQQQPQDEDGFPRGSV